MAAGKLREAAARGNLQEVLRLIEDGAKIQPDENGRNALHLASSAGHSDVVAALILAGCDVNVSDSSGCTALQRAAAEGHLEVVKQLIKHGADVNRQDNVHGNTALHEASWKGCSRSVAALGKARANLHLKNCGGFAALHLCCQNGHNQSCRELLLAGCNPNLQNNYGDTPLHTSARYGHAGVTRILISAQCQVSDQNKNGDTALHIAAAMGRRKLTRILLEAGCDKSLKNKQNETARDIATRKDLNEILVILNSPSAIRSKSKSGKTGRNEKKRGKNESGTSSKDSSSRQKDKKKHKNTHKVHFERPAGKQWSPYGCHYYPDPKAFPQPNLDSLPHEPLKKGEQYYLDLAGNICKGPVGVGYTCYCAPFFRHMEARLDRDKQELKEHIDQAHQRLDQKVSNLEHRTQGQLSELTRCVVTERALCDQRHLHLAQWITRGAAGRSSERVRGTEPADSIGTVPVPRARSLEHLLDRQTGWQDQKQDTRAAGLDRRLQNQDHRSFEMLADDGGISSWRRRYRNSSHEILCREQNSQVHQSENVQEASTPPDQTRRTYAHELACRLKQDLQKSEKFLKSKKEHNKSCETLLDKDVVSWRGQPHCKSAQLQASRTNSPESPTIQDKHNRSFDTLLDHRSNSWRNQSHYRSVNELPASQHQRSHVGGNGQGMCQSQDCNLSFDRGVTSWENQSEHGNSETHTARKEDGAIANTAPSWRDKNQKENKEMEEQKHIDTQGDNMLSDWREQPLRRTVHEMVARFQSAQQDSQVVPNWKIHNKPKSAVTEPLKFPEAKHTEPQKLQRFEGRQQHVWEGQELYRGNPAWQGDSLVVHGTNHYNCHDDDGGGSSESSEGEECPDEHILRIAEAGNPDYENVEESCPWRVEESDLMCGLPYRSRTAVYSPTHEPADLHNDSGYSTKLYGSSKGPSPSLSGQLEVEGVLSTQNMFASEQAKPSSRYHERRDKTGGTNIVAASLV